MRLTSRRGVAVLLTSTASRTCCLDILAPPMGLTSPSDVVIAFLPTNSSGIRGSASTNARVSRPAAIWTVVGRINSAEGPQGAEVIGISVLGEIRFSGSRRTDRAGSRSLRASSPVSRVCASPVVADGTRDRCLGNVHVSVVENNGIRRPFEFSPGMLTVRVSIFWRLGTVP